MIKIRREVLVNIGAVIAYSMLTGPLTVFYDLQLVGLSWSQWLGVRLLIAVLRDAPGYIMGKHADKLRVRLKAQQSRLRKIVADTMTLVAYQVPLNLLGAWIMGANGIQLVTVLIAYFLHNLLLGWVYSFIRDKFREWFLERPGHEPSG